MESVPRVAPPLASRPKLARTGSSGSGFATTAAQAIDGTKSAPTHRRAQSQRLTVDTTSDRATAAFIRRTLCAHRLQANEASGSEKSKGATYSIEELLPPLTSSNEVDLQLYALIAIIIKEYVQSWYSQITPDHEFEDEVIQMFAHCTRALEQRLRKVDLESLLLDEFPQIFDAHVIAYRAAHQPWATPPLVADPRQIYHQMHPHPALSPVPSDLRPSSVSEQLESEEQWRQLLVEAVLAVILPTEDLENVCLRALVRDVIAEVILKQGVGEKLCDPAFLYDGITQLVELARARSRASSSLASAPGASGPSDRLRRFGLLSPGKAPSSRSRAAPGRDIDRRRVSERTSLIETFWAVCQYVFTAALMIRTLAVALYHSANLPARSLPATTPPHATDSAAKRHHPIDAPGNASADPNLPPTTAARSVDGTHEEKLARVAAGPMEPHQNQPKPIISMSAWKCAAHLIELDERMPWLAGLLELCLWGATNGPGMVGGTNGRVDRLLAHHLRTVVLAPANLPPLLRALRTALFPANAPPPRPPPPGPSNSSASPIPPFTGTTSTNDSNSSSTTSLPLPHAAGPAAPSTLRTTIPRSSSSAAAAPSTTTAAPTPSPSTTATSRRRCAAALLDALPPSLATRYLCARGPADPPASSRAHALAQTERLLRVLDDPYLNRHWLMATVERALVRLFPELAEKGPAELMDERFGQG